MVPASASRVRSLRRFAGLLRRLPFPARWPAVRRALESPRARRARLERALAEPVERLLFVCHGNIMRSAFATAVARRLVPERAEVMQGAGTNATAGSAADPAAARAAESLGVSLSAHRATPLRALTAGRGDLIIAMDRANEAQCAVWAGPLSARVFLVGDIEAIAHGVPPERSTSQPSREIRDPFGQGDTAATAAFLRVRECVSRWVAVTNTASTVKN